MTVEGLEPYRTEDAERYRRLRWWPGLTWGDLLDRASDLYPRKEGLADDMHRLTYAELREKVDRLAVSLLELGVREREFALLQLPNWHEFLIAYFALQKIGAIVLLLVARHGVAEIDYLASLTGPVVWIVPERYRSIEYLPIIREVCQKHPSLKNVILTRSDGENPFPRLERLIAGADLSDDRLLQLAARRPDPMELATITPTGGTTGLPKAVPRIHNDFIANVEYHSRAWEITSEDVVLTAAPVSHGQGMLCGVGGGVYNFAKLVLTESTTPEEICQVIEKERVTAFPTVPAILQRIVGLPDLTHYDLSSLRKVYSGGAPSTPELVKAVHERLGCRFVNAYGSAEGSCAMTRLDDDFETICTTVGYKDCPYNEFRIVDASDRDVSQGREGELVTKGPTIFTGYFKSPEDNERVFTKDGFFKTGDLARIDSLGRLTITGRIKETILRGGETISAVGIERLISSHPAVADVAVIGMPDKDLGERICAYVEARPSVELTLESLTAYLRGQGASVLQLPERLELIDSIPLTKVGKADKKFLLVDICKRLGMAADKIGKDER